MIVELVRITPADKASLREWRNDPAVSKWMYTNHEIGAEGLVLGAIFLTGVSSQGSSCEWGMYLADVNARGKGIAQAACALSFRYAFNELALDVVKCEAVVQNENAIGLYESVGYVRTGVQTNAVKRGDEMLSVVTLELTRESWNTTESNVLQKLQEKEVNING